MEHLFHELQRYVKMPASISNSFGPNAPFHVQAPREFDVNERTLRGKHFQNQGLPQLNERVLQEGNGQGRGKP